MPALSIPKSYGFIDGAKAVTPPTNARIAADYATDKTTHDIGAEYGLTEGQVPRIVAALGATGSFWHFVKSALPLFKDAQLMKSWASCILGVVTL